MAYPPPGIELSNDGSVVGVADTPRPDPFCPDCFLDPQITYAFRWHDAVLTNLRALPGEGNSSFAISQNASGRGTYYFHYLKAEKGDMRERVRHLALIIQSINAHS